MLKKLSKYMKGLWGLAAISAAGMIVEAICELALPSLANSIYQKVDTAASPESVRTAVILSGLGMLALALLGLFGDHEALRQCKPAVCLPAARGYVPQDQPFFL